MALRVGNITDYFRPLSPYTWCDMLVGHQDGVARYQWYSLLPHHFLHTPIFPSVAYAQARNVASR